MSILKLSFIVLLFLSEYAQLQAQENPSSQNHFSIGFSLGALQNNWTGKSSEVFDTGVSLSTMGHVGYAAEASGVYSFSKHWNLRLGAGLQSRNIDFRIDGLHFAIDFNGTGFNDSHLIYTCKSTNLSVPLTMEYVFSEKKISPFLSLGVEGSFVLNQETNGIIYYSNGTTDPIAQTSFFAKTNVGVLAAAGIYYNTGGRISIAVSPVFRYFFAEDETGMNQYSIGATAGVYFRL